ncbi:MAG: hypothetical protein VKJ02_10780 [Snowella sp.]|nr:hypothetical protein [Snowella sp.]
MTVTQQSNGAVLFQNAWITDYLFHVSNSVKLAQSAHVRWKTENENHNILKTWVIL